MVFGFGMNEASQSRNLGRTEENIGVSCERSWLVALVTLIHILLSLGIFVDEKTFQKWLLLSWFRRC